MKKVTSDTTKKVTKNAVSKPAKKETFDYKLTMQFNDNEHIVETNDLDSAIFALKPTMLKTRIIIKVEKDGKKYESALPAFIGKQLMRNNLYRRVFLNRLILK